MSDKKNLQIIITQITEDFQFALDDTARGVGVRNTIRDYIKNLKIYSPYWIKTMNDMITQMTKNVKTKNR